MTNRRMQNKSTWKSSGWRGCFCLPSFIQSLLKRTAILLEYSCFLPHPISAKSGLDAASKYLASQQRPSKRGDSAWQNVISSRKLRGYPNNEGKIQVASLISKKQLNTDLKYLKSLERIVTDK